MRYNAGDLKAAHVPGRMHDSERVGRRSQQPANRRNRRHGCPPLGSRETEVSRDLGEKEESTCLCKAPGMLEVMPHLAPSNERVIPRFARDSNAFEFKENRKLKGFHHANVRHKQTALEVLNEGTLLKPRIGGKRAYMVERGRILLPNPQNPLSFAPRSARCLNFRLSEGAAMINRRPRDRRTDGRTPIPPPAPPLSTPGER